MGGFLFLLISCSGEENWIPPSGGATNSNNAQEPESQSSNEVDDANFTTGDPISFVATFPESQGNGMPQGPMREWTDAAIHDDQYAVQVGVSGVSLVSRSTGEILSDASNTSRAYRVDSDGSTVVVGSRTDRVSFWEVNDGRLTQTHQMQPDGTHEDVAVDNDIVAIAWRDKGLKMYRSDGTLLTNIPAQDAFAVDIFESTLAYTDQNTLILMDISDPSNPRELDRTQMPAEGRDLAWNGKHFAVGLGGNGVATYTLEDNNIIEHDSFVFDGAALSVALDDAYLWTATWSSVWLSWLGETQAFHLGQESPQSSAMGLDAEGGSAVVADWYQSTVLKRNDGLWGPEVTLPTTVFFANQGSDTQVVSVPNYASQPLTVNFTTPSDFALDVNSITVQPSQTGTVRVTSPSANWQQMNLEWSSNDPDELAGTIKLQAARDGVGSPHATFDLPLVDSQGVIGNAQLADYEDKILFLAWWSDY